MNTTDDTPGTRERLVSAMLHALRNRGLHGIGLTEILTQAQAPKGVLYHHFPQGKTELAVAAIEDASARLLSALDGLLSAKKDIPSALRSWLGSAQKQLEGSGFNNGCPLACVALESTSEDAALRQALATAFTAIRERLITALQASGMGAASARQTATLIVAAYEGALIQARVAGSTRTMADISESLIRIVQFELQTTTP